MLKVDIYENDNCEKEKFPYFNDKLDIALVIRYLENAIGTICRMFNIYFKHGELVFEPSEKLKGF